MTIEEMGLIVSLIGIVLSAFSLGYRVGQPSLVTLFPSLV